MFRFSDPEEAPRLVLEEQRDHLLAEAKSEILEQECKVDLLSTCIRECQRQAHSNRLEMDCVNHGCEGSRREQARLREELAQREKVLRENQIRSIHEVGELKRAQELTSHIQELQERMSYMNDSREFQDVESICSGRLSHVLSQPTVVPSPCGMLSRDPSLRPDTWNSLGTTGNFLDSPRAVIDPSSTPYQGMLHSWNQSATGENPVRGRYGCIEEKEPQRPVSIWEVRSTAVQRLLERYLHQIAL